MKRAKVKFYRVVNERLPVLVTEQRSVLGPTDEEKIETRIETYRKRAARGRPLFG